MTRRRASIISASVQERPASSAGQALAERQETQRCAGFACLASMVCVLLGSSLIYRADYSRVRLEAARTMNDTNALWLEAVSQQFLATQWSLVVDGVHQRPLELVRDTASAGGGSATRLETAFFRAVDLIGIMSPREGAQLAGDQNDTSLPGAPPLGRPITADLMVPRLLSLQAVYENGTSQIIPLDSIAAVEKSTAPSSSWKSCHFQEQGQWSPVQQCTVYNCLGKLCYKLSFNDVAQRWELDASFGGLGCSSSNKWSPASKRRVAVTNYRSTDPPILPLLTEEASSLTIRHAQDPVLIIKNMTQGSMQIGQVNEDEHNFGVVVAVLGAALAVPSICLLLLLTFHRGKDARHRYVKANLDDDVV